MTDSVVIDILSAQKGNIGVLSLNSPKNLNSLSLEMVEIIADQLAKWEEDDEIAVVVLKSSSDKAFCAGANVQALHESATSNPGGPCDYAETFFLKEYALDFSLHHYAKPILCLGHGIVMGGGLGLMAGCSHRIATDTSRIAMPEITIGLYPDVGGTYFLSRIPYNLGYFYGLTGAPLNANDGMFAGLVDTIVESASLKDIQASLTSQSWTNNPQKNHALLDTLLGDYALSKKDINQRIPSNLRPNLSELEEICLQPSLAEMLGALSSIETDDEWLSGAVATLEKGSPLSSLLIYEQIKRFKYSDLKTVFLSEYLLSTNIIRYPEFAEGVRALLIDKDKSPNWAFKHFSEVSSSLINQMFSAPWKENPLDKELDRQSD